MEKWTIVLNFLLDVLTLGVNYHLRKNKQKGTDNEKTVQTKQKEQ